jgi:hypothetical protein
MQDMDYKADKRAERLPTRSFLHDPLEIGETSPATQNIDLFLRINGFSPVTMGRSANCQNDILANHMEYRRGHERVFVTTHEQGGRHDGGY